MQYFHKKGLLKWVSPLSYKVFQRKVSFVESTDEDAIELHIVDESTTSDINIGSHNRVSY